MKILYLHQYFKTPSEPGGTRSYWIAKELVSRGHEVIMITSCNWAVKKVEIKNIDGIKVIYLKVPYDNSMGLFSRMLSFLKFMLWSTLIAFQQKGISLVVATSTPLTIGFPALILRIFKQVPFLFEVRDLWPAVPIQMGGLKNAILKWFAIWFEKLIYVRSGHIIALSPGMKDGVEKTGIRKDKVTMIPNMAKIDKFWPREIESCVFEKYNLNRSSFKVVHFGAMGIANGLEYIIDAAEFLKNNKVLDVDFIFLGAGAVKGKLETIVKHKELTNVFFLGKFPMDQTSEIVNACDVSIVPFLNVPILATNSPNKLFDSLSAGKPIIVNSNGWTKDMVEKFNCGFYVDANKPEEFANLLMKIKLQKEELTILGKNARALAESKYDKSILCKEFVDILELKFN